jgi:hypothetical protein
MTITGSGLGSKATKTFDLLDQIVTVLDTANNNVFFWPFLESTGDIVQSYGTGIDEQLDPIIVATTAALDAVIGFAPHQHAGGVHSYGFEAGESPALVGADAATLSFNGTTDAAFTLGCFFYVQSGTGTLIAKYDVAGSAEEYRLHILSGPDLGLEVFEVGGEDSSETAQTTTALNAGQWYFGAVAYDGTGGTGSAGGATNAADGMTIYIDGAAVAATTSKVDGAGGYADMVGGAAPLMIGATDDKAAPANEFEGRIALPFIVNAALTSANMVTLNGLGRTLLGLT